MICKYCGEEIDCKKHFCQKCGKENVSEGGVGFWDIVQGPDKGNEKDKKPNGNTNFVIQKKIVDNSENKKGVV